MSKVGRPTKYNETILAKAREYLDDHESMGDPVPSHAGLGVCLDVTRETLYQWEKEKPEFSDTLRKIKQKQEQILVAHGLLSTFNPTITKLMLANHGYSEKTQTDITSKGERIQPLLGGASVRSNDSNSETPETE